MFWIDFELSNRKGDAWKVVCFFFLSLSHLHLTGWKSGINRLLVMSVSPTHTALSVREIQGLKLFGRKRQV